MALRPGYTLIEVSVVLFLVGLLLFISMPKLGSFLFQSDLKEVARSFKSAVTVLRSKSVATHKPTALHLDLDRGLYWGTYVDPEARDMISEGNRVLFSPKRLPEGVRFLDAYNINTPKRTFGLLSSIFNSKGTLEETVIHLSDRNKSVLTIIVNAYTGRFSMYDEYVEVEYGGNEK